MKKNISVNIKGTIFNIEEEAFDVLKKYLDSLKDYFSNYEDSSEIYDDIEARVAELLHGKLSKNKEVITSEDVDQVISTMGKVEDFAEQEEEFTPTNEEGKSEKKEQTNTSSSESKRFYKDGKNKIVSGVCSGIAHYFAIDPFWIRLLFVLSPLMTFGGAIIVYIILAIILPESHDLSDDSIKKLYRDGEEAVLGGVSAGVAKFFGIDPVIVRIFFVIAAFFGLGILTYLVLWLIIPEAKTRSEKMQMEGEPITISNIEKNIKDNLNLKDQNGEESTLATILLFPFRLIAQILNGIVKLLKPISLFLLQLIRFVGGFGFMAIGFSMMFGFSVLLAVGIGIISGENVMVNSNVPIEMFTSIAPGYGLIAGFFAGFFPALLFVFLGISLFANRVVIKPIVFGAVFGFWIISLAILAGTGIYIAKDFNEEGKVKTQKSFTINSDELLIELNESESESENRFGWDNVNLVIKTTLDSNYKLVQIVESRGINKFKAKENAKNINYNFKIKGSKLTLDESLTFKDNPQFRAQNVSLTLYVPVGQNIRINENVRGLLRTNRINSIPEIDSQESNSDIDLTERVWKSEKNGIRCVNCIDLDIESEDYDDISELSDEDIQRIHSGNSMSYQVENFSKIKVTDAFEVEVSIGDEYKVKAVGDGDDLEEVEISVDDEWLTINYAGDDNRIELDLLDLKDNSRKIKVYVEMPAIDEVDISGASVVEMEIGSQPNLTIDISGASELNVDAGKIDNCTIDISGASQADLEGICSVFNVDISGASQLDARDLKSEIVLAEASGASTAKVYAISKLEAEASGISTIKYKGNPKLDLDEDGLSNIKKD